MNIAIAYARPILKLYAELCCGLGTLDELGFVDAQCLFVKHANMGHAGFTHTDDANLFRLDQTHRGLLPQLRDQRRRRHPTSTTAAHDHNPLDTLIRAVHLVCLPHWLDAAYGCWE